MSDETLDTEESAVELATKFRALGPCVALSRKCSVWIRESPAYPGFFDVQQTKGNEVQYTKHPMSCRLLRYAVRQYTGLEIDALDFQPSSGLLLDPLTGFVLPDEQEEVYVYFIQADDGGPIKIGSATNVERRLRDLQTGSPKPLRVLAVFRGNSGMERWLHGLLAAHRHHGEWFTDTDEIRAVMRELQERATMPMHNDRK